MDKPVEQRIQFKKLKLNYKASSSMKTFTDSIQISKTHLKNHNKL